MCESIRFNQQFNLVLELSCTKLWFASHVQNHLVTWWKCCYDNFFPHHCFFSCTDPVNFQDICMHSADLGGSLTCEGPECITFILHTGYHCFNLCIKADVADVATISPLMLLCNTIWRFHCWDVNNLHVSLLGRPDALGQDGGDNNLTHSLSVWTLVRQWSSLSLFWAIAWLVASHHLSQYHLIYGHCALRNTYKLFSENVAYSWQKETNQQLKTPG